jgi:hypothetical protein
VSCQSFLHLDTCKPIRSLCNARKRAESSVVPAAAVQPIPVEKFSEAVYLAEAPAHGGKPLLVFER